jgi:hypothetical protein
MSPDPGSNEGACATAGDAAIGVVVQAITAGLADGTIRRDVGAPMMFAVSLWAFTHGVIQLAMAKGDDLARLQIEVGAFCEYSLNLLTKMAAAPSCP